MFIEEVSENLSQSLRLVSRCQMLPMSPYHVSPAPRSHPLTWGSPRDLVTSSDVTQLRKTPDGCDHLPRQPGASAPPCHKSHRMLSRHCHAYLTRTEATSSTGAFDGDAGDNCLLDNFTMKHN